MIVWLKVTEDKYELPVAVADTAKELAMITGANKNSIDSAVSRFSRGINKFSVYRKVIIEGDDDE